MAVVLSMVVMFVVVVVVQEVDESVEHKNVI
jgi:hypothetical protein